MYVYIKTLCINSRSTCVTVLIDTMCAISWYNSLCSTGQQRWDYEEQTLLSSNCGQNPTIKQTLSIGISRKNFSFNKSPRWFALWHGKESSRSQYLGSELSNTPFVQITTNGNDRISHFSYIKQRSCTLKKRSLLHLCKNFFISIRKRVALVCRVYTDAVQQGEHKK